ncbi:MAG: hypothetical protein WCK02_09230 [Bacteroidota bacterium]
MYLRKGNNQSLVSFITRPSLSKNEMKNVNGGVKYNSSRCDSKVRKWSFVCTDGSSLSRGEAQCASNFDLTFNCDAGGRLVG